MSSFEQRVFALAAMRGIAIKHINLPDIAKRIRQAYPEDAAIGDDGIHAHLQILESEEPIHFHKGATGKRETADERLERANANLPPRESARAAPKPVILSEAERDRLARLPAALRLDFANKKNVGQP
jgi:hypothetical protein